MARVGARPRDDDLRAFAQRDLPDLVQVDEAALVDLVVHRSVQLARAVGRRAVGEVPTVAEVEPEEGIARLQRGEVHRGVGLGAGVGLHVHALAAGEERESPVAGEVFHDVDHFAATVVALAGQAFGVLVGERAARGLHDGGGNVVL
jgi:hypothetical protein